MKARIAVLALLTATAGSASANSADVLAGAVVGAVIGSALGSSHSSSVSVHYGYVPPVVYGPPPVVGYGYAPPAPVIGYAPPPPVMVYPAPRVYYSPPAWSYPRYGHHHHYDHRRYHDDDGHGRGHWRGHR